MAMEIDIHQSLSHANVVGFHGFFEDKNHVYILLELCRRRSMMELHKRRKALTEPEVRYFLRQTLLGLHYLHTDKKVIHRDIKLGNLFLNDDLEVKLGDFGLATRVETEGERKRTLCGTPNYIAPEVLGKKGHSYEVDIWSVGCVMYTLLVGKPPFETQSLKDTYQKIKRNEYRIPSYVGRDARSLITRLLQSEPTNRPSPGDILEDPFITGGYLPAKLPNSCLTTAPHWKKTAVVAGGGVAGSGGSERRPLSHVNSGGGIVGPTAGVKGGATPSPMDDSPSDWHLHSLLAQLTSCLDSKPPDRPSDQILSQECEDPASQPIFWVGKWVDYSDKYGLGYQLSDSSVGVLFNDSTRLLLGADFESLQFINRDLSEEFYTLSSYPDPLYKKVTLLKYFHSYMTEHLLKAGGAAGERPIDEGVRLPHLRAWFRTRSAIVLHLSNGLLQINFFNDHTKVMICPLMSALSYIDEHKTFTTYKLSLIEKHGCNKELATRLRYAKAMTERLISRLDPGVTTPLPHPTPTSNPPLCPPPATA
jgi:polo-like kinase 1